jgi:hypothetical protein
MRFSLSTVFYFYLAFFLVVIFSSWLLFIRRRRRLELSERRIFICGFCGLDFRESGPGDRLRCPQCGAAQKRDNLKERKIKDGNVDR